MSMLTLAAASLNIQKKFNPADLTLHDKTLQSRSLKDSFVWTSQTQHSPEMKTSQKKFEKLLYFVFSKLTTQGAHIKTAPAWSSH